MIATILGVLLKINTVCVAVIATILEYSKLLMIYVICTSQNTDSKILSVETTVKTVLNDNI